MSKQTVNSSANEFTITRTFDAPLERVWKVWTDAKHFEQWFHAKPGTVALDVRTGGSWKATMLTPQGEMAMGGKYREVVDRKKLVWDMPTPGEPVVMHATFAERDGQTIATYGQNVTGPFSCDQAIAGATGILDSFEAHLASTLKR